MSEPPSAAVERLEHDQFIWLATVRPDGRPHLVPLWYVWAAGRIYLCIQANSVKARNMQANPEVSLALDHGERPVLVEGVAAILEPPWPDLARQGFQHKYHWNIAADADYDLLLAVTPGKWLNWSI
ncbi:MAG: pyridoxamine 5'-phosphate oxidase [Oscillochloris sp.]|nr:pyridoxamine 5'-phosphate oxidase [Oscillochloris sp.]